MLSLINKAIFLKMVFIISRRSRLSKELCNRVYFKVEGIHLEVGLGLGIRDSYLMFRDISMGS